MWLDFAFRTISLRLRYNCYRLSRHRRGGRAVEGARLESVYTLIAYRGFESLPLRQLPVEAFAMMRC